MVKLEAQIFAYRPEAGEVIAVQRWSGFVRGLAGLVIVVNDRVHSERPGAARTINKLYAGACAVQQPYTVTEDEARAHLADLTGATVRQCLCGADLPMGGRWCTACGQPNQVPASAGTCT